MGGAAVLVQHQGHVKNFILRPTPSVLAGLVADVITAFDLQAMPLITLVQVTTLGRHKPVQTDDAVLDISAAVAHAPLLVQVGRPLLTVENFIRTMLSAILDTPVAKRELAALFLAASWAWEHAVREHGWRYSRGLETPPSINNRTNPHVPRDPLAVPANIINFDTIPGCNEADPQNRQENLSLPLGRPLMRSPARTAQHRSQSQDSLIQNGDDDDDADHYNETDHDVGSTSNCIPLMPSGERLHCISPRDVQHLAPPEPVSLPPLSLAPCFDTRLSSPLPDDLGSHSPHPGETIELSRSSVTPEIARPASPDHAIFRDFLGRRGCSGGDTSAEQRALACFCTHHGVTCWGCKSVLIEGPRFVCTSCATNSSISLCAQCRRTVSLGDDCRIVVYDHPWEADEEYASVLVGLGRGAETTGAPPDFLVVPRAPLGLGDRGPRVTHLHYVLYKMGYLRICNDALQVGEFCEETKKTVARFQVDHQLIKPLDASRRTGTSGSLLGGGGEECGDELGVYSAVTRRAILELCREVEMRYMGARCRRGSGGTERLNLRTAIAA